MRDATFGSWRAAAGPWAQWIKPSLLVTASGDVERKARESPDVSGWPLGSDTALIIDLPGVEAVEIGAALNEHQYCPVPLFNTTSGGGEIVPTAGLIDALVECSVRLRARSSGPPAFLLDAYRQHGQTGPGSTGDFDNRWYVFASDLPTESRLIDSGIHRLVVVCRTLAPDLHDALAHHQRLQPMVLSPRSGESWPLPRNRSGIARGLSQFGRVLHRNLDGSFGHRISQG
jgi:hypothetical protein